MKNYEDMKLTELRALLKKRDMKGSSLSKSEIIQVLKKDDYMKKVPVELKRKYGSIINERYKDIKPEYDLELYCRYYKDRKTDNKVITYGCFWSGSGIDKLICEMDGVFFKAETEREISAIADTLFDIANKSICYCQYLEGRKLTSYTKNKLGFKAELQRFDVRAELVQNKNIREYDNYKYFDESLEKVELEMIPIDITEGRRRYIGEELSDEDYLNSVKGLHERLFGEIFITGVLHIERLYQNREDTINAQQYLTKDNNRMIVFNGRFPYERELRHIYDYKDNGYYPFWGCDSSYRRSKLAEAEQSDYGYYGKRRGW